MGTLIDTNRTRYTWAKVSTTQFEDVPYALAAPTTGVTDANYTDFYTVTVLVNGVEQVISSYTPSTNKIDFGATPPAQGALLTIQVVTDTAGRNVTYNTVGQLRGNSLNQDSEQNYTLALQALEAADRAMLLEPTSVTASEDVWDARERRITDVATPTADTDAATKGYADTQDTATLGTATDYTDAREVVIRAYVDSECDSHLAEANDYTDTELASGLATKADLNGSTSQHFNVKSPLLSTHATPVSYVQAQDAAALQSAKDYADALPSTVNEDAGQILIGTGSPGATSSAMLTFDNTLGSELLTVDADASVTGNALLGTLSIGTVADSADILYESSLIRVEHAGSLIELQTAPPTLDSSVATKKYVDDGLATKALLAGSALQVFSVGTATLDAHAVNKGYADGLVSGTTGKYAVFDATGIADGRLNDDVDGGVTLEVAGVSRFRAYTSDGTSYAGFKALSAEGVAGELNVYSSTSAATKYGDSVANDVSLHADFDLYLGSSTAGKIVIGIGASKIITAESSGVTLSVEGTADGHLVTKKYVDDEDAKHALLAGSSSQTFAVATPTDDTHAATKLYVDSAVTSNPLVLEDTAWGGGLDDDTMTLTAGTITNTDAGITVKHLDDDGIAYRTAAVVFRNGGDLVLDPQYDYGASTFSRMPNVQTPVLSRFFVSSAYDADGGATMDIGIGRGAAWTLRLLRSQYQGFVGVSDTDGAFMLGNTTSAGAYVGATLIKASSTGSTISSQDNLGTAKETTVATGLNVSGQATATTALVGKTGAPSKAMEIYDDSTTYKLRLSDATESIDLGLNASGELALSKPLPVASGGTGLATLAAGRIPYGAGTGDFGNSADFYYGSIIKDDTTLDANTGGVYVSASGSYSHFTAKNSSGPAFAQLACYASGGGLMWDIAKPFYFIANNNPNAQSVTEYGRFDTSGNLGINTQSPDSKLHVVGGIRATAGIQFGTGALAAANTLDDYEEGTWTPVLSDGTNNATMAGGGATEGVYTKIGNMVYISCRITTTALGSVSGNLRITGLPFSVGKQAALTVGFASGLAITAGTSVTAYAEPGTTTLFLYNWDATTGTSNLQATEWTDDGGIRFSMAYSV